MSPIFLMIYKVECISTHKGPTLFQIFDSGKIKTNCTKRTHLFLKFIRYGINFQHNTYAGQHLIRKVKDLDRFSSYTYFSLPLEDDHKLIETQVESVQITELELGHKINRFIATPKVPMSLQR